MGSLWRFLRKICLIVKDKAEEHDAGSPPEADDMKKTEHLHEVRRRRINKLENMKQTAAIDGDEQTYEYTEQRLATLKRLEQEAELIRLGATKKR